jgi:actin-like ATPase involved in cell morphogenesis
MAVYVLGVDLGTTFSAAAVGQEGQTQVFQLGTRIAAIPSVVLLRDDGTVMVGEAAERRSVTEPANSAREFKRRLGDPTPIVLGGTPYGAESLTAHLLRDIVRRVEEEQGEPPMGVVVTHPATYGPYKMEVLEEAVRHAEVGPVSFLPEPAAAAIHYSAKERVEPGDLIAVFDLGGGTLDIAVLRKEEEGFEILGTPEGMDRFGGIDLDEAVLGHVRTALGDALDGVDLADPAARAAMATLRTSCRDAKESLSVDTDAVIPVMLPSVHTEVRLTRAEFENMVRPRLEETLRVLDRVVGNAGCTMDDLTRILLVGGASRMPLVAEMVASHTRRPIAVDANPKHAVALGAARVALEQPGSLGADPTIELEPSAPTPEPASGGAPPTVDDRPWWRRWWPAAAALPVVAAGVLLGVQLLGGGSDDPGPADDASTTITTTTTTTLAAAEGNGVGNDRPEVGGVGPERGSITFHLTGDDGGATLRVRSGDEIVAQLSSDGPVWNLDEAPNPSVVAGGDSFFFAPSELGWEAGYQEFSFIAAGEGTTTINLASDSGETLTFTVEVG